MDHPGETYSSQPFVLKTKGVFKRFGKSGSPSETVALRGVDLTIGSGEAIALVGESGSGKSTFARIVSRLETADSGELHLQGENIPLEKVNNVPLAYRRSVQMIFQDPFGSLNPVHPIAHHLVRPLLRHGRATPSTVREKAAQLLEEVGLCPAEDFLDRYPYELSGGQRQRVAIARALAVEPVLLVADEPTSMLDVSIRLEVLQLLDRIRKQRSIAILLITHDLGSARYLASRVAVLYKGAVVEEGPTSTVLKNPSHPYTQLLLESSPESRGSLTRPVSPPAYPEGNASSGCAFLPRCAHGSATCEKGFPEPVPLGNAHWSACFQLQENRTTESAA